MKTKWKKELARDVTTLAGNFFYFVVIVILLFFTSLFYKEVVFTIFSISLFFTLVWFLHYLIVKNKLILKGIIAGIVSTTTSYYLTLVLT